MKLALRNNKGFEILVLRFICLIGAIRMLFELCINVQIGVSSYEWIMHISMTSVIVIFFGLTYSTVKAKWVISAISVIATIFLAIRWINQGGIYGTSEYNLLAMIVVVGAIHSGRTMKFFLGFVLLTIVSLVLLWEFSFSTFEPIVHSFSDRTRSYIGAVLLVTLIVNFMRYMNEKKIRQINNHNEELSARAMELNIENESLMLNHQEYERINQTLENEVVKRKIALDKQTHALQGYLEISLKEFDRPMQDTLKSINDFSINNGAIDSVGMLSKSAADLKKAYGTMQSNLKDKS